MRLRFVVAVVFAFLLGVLVDEDAAGESVLSPAPTSSDRLPHSFGDLVAALHDRTPPTSPPTTVLRLAAASKRVREGSAPSTPVGAVPDLIRQGFAHFGPDVAEEAVRVAGCETGWTYDPTATNGVHAGLFQLSGRYHQPRAARLGFAWAQMWEAVPNITVAADLYAEQGWGPWTCRYAA